VHGSAAAPPALELAGVSLRYGGLVVLSSVDLAFAAGHVTGLIGPNGAGKTSLLDVVTGLVRPTAGRVMLHGEDVTGRRPAYRSGRGLARTFQRLELFWSLTVSENLDVAAEAACRLRLRPARWHLLASEAPGRVVEQLGRTGLSGLADERVDTLSTGTARLAEVARALATRPSVLMLDEPASGLDRVETNRLGELLVELAGKGMAVVLVEHDVELVMRICDRVYVLDRGSVLAHGAPESVRTMPEVRDAYLGQLAAT
jgi:branched-chain amino acid transport system ATP-binding protein